MIKTYQMMLTFYFLGLCFSSCSSKHKISKPGKYATYFPGYSSIKYYRMIPMKINQMHLQHKHKKDFKDMFVVTLYLRKDSSFLFSFCQDQIMKAGKYIFENDSLKLYNVFDFSSMKKSADEMLYVYKNGKTIFIVFPNDIDNNNHKRYKYKEHVTTVQYNKFMHHNPIIRNEDWSLDSIYKYNVFWPLDKQLNYLDSISNVHQK